jgi:N-acetyltransferase
VAPFDLQPTLQNELVSLRPLRESDFDSLYAVSSDPLIWQQHPKPRFTRDSFEVYFKEGIASKGALLVADSKTGNTIGSSRYYDLSEEKNEVAIGYTFLARSHWGGPFNSAMKSLMLAHAFQFAERVIFHVGENNIRSRTAMTRIGGVLVKHMLMENPGGSPLPYVVFQIERRDWMSKNPR